MLYADDLNMVNVKWEGFYDDESGIKIIEIALYSSETCRNIYDETELYQLSSDTLPGNATNYTFSELELQVNNFPRKV